MPTVLAGLTLLWPRPQIEDTLTRGANSALAAAGVRGGALHFDGRDATITGSSSDAGAAVRTVESVTGVRIARIGADAGITALPPAQAPPSTAAASPSPTPAPRRARRRHRPHPLLPPPPARSTPPRSRPSRRGSPPCSGRTRSRSAPTAPG